jgi:hypothetical protein
MAQLFCAFFRCGNYFISAHSLLLSKLERQGTTFSG